MNSRTYVSLKSSGSVIVLAGLIAWSPVDAQASAPALALAPITPSSSASVSAPNAQAGAPQNGAGPSGGAGVGEIIVTAQRRAERLSRVPVAVSALSGSQLKTLNVRTTADLARSVPAFQSATSALSGAPVFTLRGVGFNTSNITATAPVGLYVDEVAYAYPLMADGELYDLERVEVLKGPQGTLYGRNTTGGLIDYVPAKPTNTPSASVTSGFGNYGSYEFSGFVNGPISDTLKARFAFNSENRADGWQHSITRDDSLGKLHRNAVRGILDWNPGSSFHTELSANYWRRTGDTQAGQAIKSIDSVTSPEVAASIDPHPHSDTQADWAPRSDQPFSSANGIIRPPDRADNKFFGTALKATYDLNSHLSLVSLTSYNRLIFDQLVDPSGVQTEQFDVSNKGHVNSFAEEFRLVGDYDKFKWSLGGYYASDHTAEIEEGYAGENPTVEGLKALAVSVPSAYTPEQLLDSYRVFGSHGTDKTRVSAVFANASYSVSQKVSINAGARFTNDHTRYSGAQFDINGSVVPVVNVTYPIILGHSLPALTPGGSTTLNATDTGFAIANETQNKNNVSWHATLDWTPSGNSLFYASISRGFKSGAFPVLNASAIAQLNAISQEKLTDYEVGEKISLLNRHLQINTSLFYYDYRNHQIFGQIPDLIFGTLNAIVNVPKSHIYGVDGDISYSLTSTLRLDLSGSILRTRIDDYTGSDPFGAIINYHGARLPFAPKYSAFGSVSKDIWFGRNLGVQLVVDGTFQSSSSSYIGSDPDFRIAPYTLFGASITLHNRGDKWRLTTYIRNAFDKYYWTSGQVTHDTIARYAGMPRTFGLRGTVNF